MYTAEDFPFAGTRVILNPELRGYERLKEQVGSVEGYIINDNASTSGLRQVLDEPSHISDWNVEVEFDNGERVNLSVSRILIVDVPLRPVIRVSFQDGHVMRMFEDKIEDQIIRHIIQENTGIHRIRKYDENYKDIMLNDRHNNRVLEEHFERKIELNQNDPPLPF